jgi:hypothetical protein
MDTFTPNNSPANCFYVAAAREVSIWKNNSKGWQNYFTGDTTTLLLNAFHGELGSNRNQEKVLKFLAKYLK